MGDGMDQDLCGVLVSMHARQWPVHPRDALHSPFGSFAIAELLSSGLLLLLMTSNRGPSAGFLGVFTRAFSYSLILSRGGGVEALLPLSPRGSSVFPSALVAREPVASP
jgi:hypothetical protein